MAPALGLAESLLVMSGGEPVVVTSYQTELSGLVFTVPAGELEPIALLANGTRVRGSAVHAQGEEREILLR